MQSSMTLSSMMRKKEPLSRHHWIDFLREYIESKPSRSQKLCRQCHVWVRLWLASVSWLLMILQLYHLPPPLHPTVSKLFLTVHLMSAPVGQLSYSTVLYGYQTVKLKMFYFLCLFFMYYMCEKYYKPIII